MKIIKLALICIAPLVISSQAVAGSSYDGFYAGAQVGYADGNDKGKEFANGEFEGWTQKTKLNDGLIGGFVGFNKVLENNVLLGVEGDYEYRGSSDKDTQKLNGVEDDCCKVKTKLKDSATLRAKLGFIFNENKTLAYLTAGYATLKTKRNYDFQGNTSSIHFGETQWHDGWTAGFGLEHMIADKISAKAEYRYSDYGRENVKTTNNADSIVEKQRYENEQSLRLGVSYHF